jgi:protein-disulfide isomerase
MFIQRALPFILLILMVIGMAACQSGEVDESVETSAVETSPIDVRVVNTDAKEETKADIDESEHKASDDDSDRADGSQESADEDLGHEVELPDYLLPKPADINMESESLAFSIGEPSAPIRVVEFTDYQCPFCQMHALETMPALMENLIDSGRVFYAIKDLPLEQLHPEARMASVAARCAGEQNAYLEMHDAIFGAQRQWSGTGGQAIDSFTNMAAELELDVDTFEICLAQDNQAGNVQANLEEAMALGVNSTPFFFIDGYAISGAQPYEVFEMAVVLAEQGELDDVIEAQARQVYQDLLDQETAQAATPSQAPSPPIENLEISLDDAYSIGDPDAPVTIVEYTDYQCPYCARHALQTFGQIAEDLVDTGQVRYVFKDMPLTSIHPQAMLAAEAARCAGDQDDEAFVTMHDLLFENQRSWSGRSDAADLFVSYASEIGLDGLDFESCIYNDEFESAVRADIQEAMQLGITGTPAFIINGQLMFGAQPYEVFEKAVDSFLVEASADMANG